MALRSAEFRDCLKRHVYKQNGEGLCWVALMEAFLNSRGEYGLDRRQLVTELNTTVKYGTDGKHLINFLRTRGIPHFEMERYSYEELQRSLLSAPTEVDFFAGVWDCRISPGFNKFTDPPESHVVAILDITDKRVRFYDPSTYLGGVLEYTREEWEKWWIKDGPESGIEYNCDGTESHYVSGWVMVLGADKLF